MARTVLTVLTVVVAFLAGFYQLNIKPKLVTLGLGRVVEVVGNSKCKVYPELKACEKIVLHQPTGVLYLACSVPSSRSHWTPAVGRLNATGKSTQDYVATFDPATATTTRLTTSGFASPRGLGLHGMDVVPSRANASELFVYLVNHRAPAHSTRRAPAAVGADSAVEVFAASVGGAVLTHLRTVEDAAIATPNDVVGSADGESFYFTNDHGPVKTGLSRDLHLDVFLKLARSTVGYCHVDEGCKIAAGGLVSANGIAKNRDNQFFVASSALGEVSVLEQQSDNSLVVTDVIHLDRPVDNLSMDEEGSIWGAGLVNGMHLVTVHFEDPSINTPSSAIRFSLNKGQSQYFGEKYKVDRVFEDDGEIASGSTSAVYDSQRNRLFMHGVAAPQLTVCQL